MHQHNLKKVMRPDRTINSDYDQTNFSVIPASGTVALSIQCAELVGHESRLAERSLQHLASLRDLRIAHCKLAVLPRHSLAGLQRLANLSVHTQPRDGGRGAGGPARCRPPTRAFNNTKTIIGEFELNPLYDTTVPSIIS